MSDPARPYRSMLFSPASNTRALAKLGELACDGVIIDLEDAVGDAQKAQARDNLAEFAKTRIAGGKTVLIRVNDVASPLFTADVRLALLAHADGIVLPKVNNPDDLLALVADLEAAGSGETPIWAMIETPMGVLNLREICAATPHLAGLILGPNDLTKDLQAERTADRVALSASMGAIVLAARAFGLICLDGVYNAFRDDAGFLAECQQGRVLGFDGKTLIHPSQIDAANRVFAPSDAELDLARRKIAAFEEARATGAGLVVFEGEMVEELHIQSARAVLEKHRIIKELEQDRTAT